MTDTHLPMPKADDKDPSSTLRHTDRFVQALRKSKQSNPSLYIFGGDNVMAVDQGNPEEHADRQFANWKGVIDREVKVSHASVIGNHDIWYPKDGERADRKKKAVEAFKMPNRYYRVDHQGWSFFLLDVFHPGGPTGVDKEQFAWLDEQLAKTSGPACVVSHAPIFSPSCQVDGDAVGGKKELRELFRKHENVRLALSGHQHWVDRAELDRVTYLCGGAVSGAWWGGEYQHFPPAYTILDLGPKGEVAAETVFWETAGKQRSTD